MFYSNVGRLIFTYETFTYLYLTNGMVMAKVVQDCFEV